MPRHAIVELRDQFGDGGVQLGEREEAPIAQLGDDPAGRHLHRHFDLGLVARPVRPRRHNGRVVVGRHLGIGAVDRRLVEARLGDARPQIVGHHLRRTPPKNAKARVCEPIQSDRPCVQVASA